MTQEKLLDKLTKLKRHADSAKAIGSEAEAQAFAEKLQSLLLEHDLQMSDLDFEKLAVDEPIGDNLVDFAEYGIPVKKSRVAWMQTLAVMVAKANFCRVLVYARSSNFTLVGRAEHRAVAEYMIVTLTRAVMDISKTAHTKYIWEVWKRDHSTAAARGFKDSFITGFLYRLFERIEARKNAAAGSSSTALVRINRETQAVDDEMTRRQVAGQTRKMHGLRLADPSNREGIRRGKDAADKVNLDGKAVAGSAGDHAQLR